jgi:hypothetical protein
MGLPNAAIVCAAQASRIEGVIPHPQRAAILYAHAAASWAAQVSFFYSLLFLFVLRLENIHI